MTVTVVVVELVGVDVVDVELVVVEVVDVVEVVEVVVVLEVVDVVVLADVVAGNDVWSLKVLPEPHRPSSKQLHRPNSKPEVQPRWNLMTWLGRCQDG